jgi:hypothetical protein
MHEFTGNNNNARDNLSCPFEKYLQKDLFIGWQRSLLDRRYALNASTLLTAHHWTNKTLIEGQVMSRGINVQSDLILTPL